MKIWQIACGRPGIDYRELFFNHDIMLLGPSNKGPASDGKYDNTIQNSIEYQVWSFYASPKPYDIVVLRFRNEVIGIGMIPDADEWQYSFDKRFSSVYGWDLCHCRRVIWYEGLDISPIKYVYRQVKQKPSFSGDYNQEVIDFVNSIDHQKYIRKLKDLPTIDCSIYSEEELGIELFKAGISNNNIKNIIDSLSQANRLYNWYMSEQCGRKPTENEVVSHIILPFFLSLGWSHQQIAVEWKNVDMAFFKKTPTISDNCLMILEAKDLDKVLEDVLDQPIGYRDKLKLNNTHTIVVSNGQILLIYKETNQGWGDHPIGFIDFNSLQKQYIVPKDTDLIESLVMLLPSSL